MGNRSAANRVLSVIKTRTEEDKEYETPKEPKHNPNDRHLFSVTTWAGDGTINTRDGSGTSCGINWPYEIKFDSSGNGYFTAYGSASIRKITPEGYVSTIIQRTEVGESFHCVRGLALDKYGNIYFADTGNNVIRKVFPDGQCETISSTQFSSPYGIAVADDGTIYVSDTYADRIKAIDVTGKCRVIAGSTEGYLDGKGKNAKFSSPQGIEIDREGNLIVADCRNNVIRKIDKHLNVTTIATGFNSPYGVAIDKRGNIFVADYGNHEISRIDSKGTVRPIAGANCSAFKQEPKRLNLPTGVGVDNFGNLIICDCYNHILRKVNCVLDVHAENWPYCQSQLPEEIQKATSELLCVLSYKPPQSLPKELIVLLIRLLIENWPI
jgi:sugar lactone lactonase YvrE